MKGFSNFKFTPLSMRPVLWIDASAQSYTDGSSVQGVIDSSENKNHLVQIHAGRPIFRANAFKGVKGLDCGFNVGMEQTSAITLGAHWAFFIAEYVTANNNGIRTIQSNTGGTNKLLSISRADGITAFFENTLMGARVEAGKTGVGVMKTGVTNLEGWINGVNRTVATIANGAFGTFGFGTAGAWGEPALTTILEVLVFDRYVTPHEQRIVEAYLMSKYGVVEGSL
jgi:hypothetical protein